MEKITNSELETFEFGQQIAHLGQTFLLYGELGVGKTALIRGICSALGVDEKQIHSPTFAIVNEYESPNGTIFHFDAYRLTPKSWLNDGFDEYLDKGICLIEWAENLPPIVNAIKIEIKGSGDKPRWIKVTIEN